MAPSRRSYRELKPARDPVKTAPPAQSELSRLMDDYLDVQESKNLSHYTIRNYRYTFASFRQYLATVELPETKAVLTTDTIRAFQRWLQTTPTRRERLGSRKRTPGGVAVWMRQIRAFCRHLQEEDHLQGVVKVRVPKLPPRTVDVLTADQVTAIFRSRHLRGDSAMAKRNRALVALFLDSGLRVAEVADIEDADLFLDAEMVRVTGKGIKTRIVPFSPRTRELIADWIAARDADPVELKEAVRDRTFELQRTGIQMLFQRVGEDVGFPFRLHPHLFRHTAATMMLKQGMDLHSLKRVLGHSHISTTEIYLTLSSDDLKDKHRSASPMAGFDPQPEEQPLVAMESARPKGRRLDSGRHPAV